MLVRAMQLENADLPIVVTPSGMVKLVNVERLDNADLPIMVAPLGRVAVALLVARSLS